MGTVILYIFMATASPAAKYNEYRQWTEQGYYKTMEACEKAIVRLNISETGRCVSTI